MGELAGMTLLIKALGIGLVPGIVALVWLVMSIMIKFIERKQVADRKERMELEAAERAERRAKEERDRLEHMAKWDSMVKLQADAIVMQTQSLNRVVDAHKKEIDRIIDTHNEETERHGRLFERQAAALESLTVELTRVTDKLNQKNFCPRGEDDGK